MVLPVLGGSPAVWSIALVFFQALLLAGYCYAHLLARYASTRRGAGAASRAHARRRVEPADGHSGRLDERAGGRRGVLAARPLRRLGRAAVLRPRRQRAPAAGLVLALGSSARRRPVFPLRRLECRLVHGPRRLSARGRAPVPDAGADRRLVHGLCRARGPHRRLRSSRRRAPAAARDGSRRRRDGRHRAGAVAGAGRLGRPRLCSVRPSRRRHGPHLDRHRRGAAAMGRAAGAVPAHLRPRLPRQGSRQAGDARAPPGLGHGAGADDRHRERAALAWARASSRPVLRQRDAVPWRALPPQARRNPPDRVLRLHVARRGPRRHRLRASRPAAFLARARVPDAPRRGAVLPAGLLRRGARAHG